MVGLDEARGGTKDSRLVWGIRKDELFRPLEGGFDSSGAVGTDFRLSASGVSFHDLLELDTGVGGLVDVIFVCHT